jgi:hypothetical protein
VIKLVAEEFYLDMLTKDSVSVRKQKFVNVDGEEHPVGETWRRAYVNSTAGRQQVQDEVPEPYRSAIFAVWGEEPTVADPVGESPAEEDAGSAE